MTDLLGLTAELVDIPSVSHAEKALADHVEAGLRDAGYLAVDRFGDTVVARTTHGRARRLLLAGHLDTVPPFTEAGGHSIDGDTLWGLGAVDMKGGLAVLLDLARSARETAVDVTYVFYTCEEVERRHNGLGHLAAERPEILVADAAVLAEPTGGLVEAGCQGSMRVDLTLIGRRAHTARPWTGVNAVQRLAPVLHAVAGYVPRRVVLNGCEYAEQLQAVAVSGGVAGNVVPDEATLTVNFRFAPDRTVDAAEAEVRRLLGDTIDPAVGDRLVVVDAAAGAPPALDHPLLADLVGATGHPPRAKLGWTDVATLFAAGVPAANFGPGDPLLAHTPDEHVSSAELNSVRVALARILEKST
ncbi:MAG TPA: succinyl-diaminopimelate desuccinylase [Acidimicrobiales bacterium]|jgi:succinyl-diaminopimelate desuccinylase